LADGGSRDTGPETNGRRSGFDASIINTSSLIRSSKFAAKWDLIQQLVIYGRARPQAIM